MVFQILLLVAGAVLGVVATQLYARWKAEPSEYEIWYDVQARSLRSEVADRLDAGLQYSVGGKVVDDPWVVEVDIWNGGTKDVRKDMFHEGVPFVLSLHVPVIAGINGDRGHGDEPTSIHLDTDGDVIIQPSLVKQGMVKTYRIITEGKPKETWKGSIADLQVHELRSAVKTVPRHKQLARIFAWACWVIVILTFLSMIIVAIVPPADALREKVVALGEAFAFIPIVVSALMFAGFALSAYAHTITRVAKRAISARRAALSKAPQSSHEPLYSQNEFAKRD